MSERKVTPVDHFGVIVFAERGRKRGNIGDQITAGKAVSTWRTEHATTKAGVTTPGLLPALAKAIKASKGYEISDSSLRDMELIYQASVRCPAMVDILTTSTAYRGFARALGADIDVHGSLIVTSLYDAIKAQ